MLAWFAKERDAGLNSFIKKFVGDAPCHTIRTSLSLSRHHTFMKLSDTLEGVRDTKTHIKRE